MILECMHYGGGAGKQGYKHDADVISMVVRSHPLSGEKMQGKEMQRLHTELPLERSMYGKRRQSLPGVKTEWGW